MSGASPSDRHPGPIVNPSDAVNAPLRILLVDDEEVVHVELEKILKRRARRWELRCFLGAAEALQQIPIDRPDIVLVDTDMPGINGMDFTKMLKAISPGLPVLLLAPRVSHTTVSAYRHLAAHGYLTKPLAPEVLVEAIASAVRGLHFVCDEAAEILANFDPAQAASGRHGLLTARECQIMDRVAQGWRDKDIGAALGIAASTVHAHRTNVYRRLGARGRSDAVCKYLQT